MAARTALLVVALLLLLAGALAGTWRVATLESFELEHETEWRSLAAASERPGSTDWSARLAEVELRRGEQAVFEICSDDRLAPERWAGTVEVVVWRPEEQDLLLRVPLDAELLEDRRADGDQACLPLGRGPIDRAGSYAVEAVWQTEQLPEEVAEVPLRVRVLARVPLSPADRLPVALSLLGALLLVGAFLWGARLPGGEARGPARSEALIRLAAGVALAVGAAAAVATLPVRGAAASLMGGLAFAAVEVLIAVVLVAPVVGAESLHPRHRRAEALGLVRPHAPWTRVLVVTLATTVALVLVARLALLLVPKTGQAPIETFVSWPSGLLGFALLAVLVPLAEELFFRGFVYGTALRFGRLIAFVLAAGLFVAAHAPQVWGGWGGLVAVGVTGLGLTALRAWTGSILPGAAAHLAYNTLLAVGAVL